ncbi:MAG: amidohydrolase [Lysobacterales bacterium]|nr:MAG: amidohydrolase [Xanthomonadales bacterium]
MNGHINLLSVTLLVGCVLAVAGCKRQEAPGEDAPAVPEAAVTLVSNARIYTFDPGDTVIPEGALAISSTGEILAIGDRQPMEQTFPGARRLDLGGLTVLPGLIDAHGHLFGLAQSLTQADLVGATSKAEAIARLREFEAALPDGAWLLGHGWDQNDWPDKALPGRADLDAEFPNRPVWLERIDGHAAWANTLAIAAARRVADRDLSGDWQPEGGFIHRDADGAPSGIFVDTAMGLILPAVPAAAPELLDGALDRATEMLASLGLTGVHDPGVNRSVIELYRAKIAAGAMPLRIYAMADGTGEALDWLCANGPLDDPSGRLQMRSVKLYADGALGSRGAALLTDYADDPGNQGLLFAPDDALQEQMRSVLSCGLQLGVHAIGDRANRQVLDAYERLLPEFPHNPGRHRIEHAQVLDPADVPRFATLGVIAAMQPTHATSDMYWAEERLGAQRLAGAYAWRSLADTGAILAFGSDFPVERPNPMLGIHAAVSRQDSAGWPEGGWQPQERLGRAQAIRAFTMDAARAAFMEDLVGSLEPGKRADFIVLDRDLMVVPVEEIPAVQVLQTWLDGEPVFQRAGQTPTQ